MHAGAGARLTHEQALTTTDDTSARNILIGRTQSAFRWFRSFSRSIIRFAGVRSVRTHRSPHADNSFFLSIFTSFVATKTAGKYYDPITLWTFRSGDVFRCFARVPDLCVVRRMSHVFPSSFLTDCVTTTPTCCWLCTFYRRSLCRDNCHYNNIIMYLCSGATRLRHYRVIRK